MPREENIRNDNLIIGRNPVMELLKSGREIENIMVAKGEREGSVSKILAICKQRGIVVKTVDRKKLDHMCGNANHQGVVANVPAHSYSTIDEILEYAGSKNEDPFIIICDEIEDSHNLGAIIRSAEACGAHGIIIPKRRNVGLNYVVAKTSCGALEYHESHCACYIAVCEDRGDGEGVGGDTLDGSKRFGCGIGIVKGFAVFQKLLQGRGEAALGILFFRHA